MDMSGQDAITSAMVGDGDAEKYRRLNSVIISQLPGHDKFPTLSKSFSSLL